jgi:branched-chain amino acid transport system ATP-binding protein
MLAIGRALMTNPKLLILDEATEGLLPVVRQEIGTAIHELKLSGLSILVIDKSLKELAAVPTAASSSGAAARSGPPAAGLTPEITDRYLGL